MRSTQRRRMSPVSPGLASALSFGTTTAALWMTAGLLTAVLGSSSKLECETPAGKRGRLLVMFRAAKHTTTQRDARKSEAPCQSPTADRRLAL